MSDNNKSDEQEYLAFVADQQIDRWTQFLLDLSPSDLAEYLRLGGEVDQDVRRALIDVLEKAKGQGHPGGKKPFRDYHVYVSVNAIIRSSKLASNNGDESKPLSPTAAKKVFAERHGRELRAVELQYDRGKLVSEEFRMSTKQRG
ncbi:hypothetical protein WG622_11410 [Cognatishimia sp. D5M38]|uniref:Uncharacterized protein n=1 Tax=Cognatishimia coralii TaxID=3083254 RepID=A0ABU8QHG3_9RHOB